MKITPTLKATRSAQLQAGELFLFGNGAGAAVGLAARDPARDGDMAMIVLGGGMSPDMVGRVLDLQYMDVISFGTDYEVRLPCRAGGWSIQPPPPEKLCLVFCAYGQSDQRLFLRANFSPDAAFRPCYIDMKESRILAAADQMRAPYIAPPGIFGYAVEWALLTDEGKPRVILSYPPQVDSPT